ncbi:hypothetical protein BGU93_19390 [Clostridioides difficile]|nr:hypothetical protein BGU93_19390 [Clostridioides difficile]
MKGCRLEGQPDGTVGRGTGCRFRRGFGVSPILCRTPRWGRYRRDKRGRKRGSEKKSVISRVFGFVDVFGM